MTDPNDTAPNADPYPTPAPTTEVGLGGVTAQADAGATNPQPEAAPAASQPAEPPAGTTPVPTGQAPADPAATEATPGATEGERMDIEHMVNTIADAQHREVMSNINAIEQIALFWGGETGTKIRNHVGRIRELLQ